MSTRTVALSLLGLFALLAGCSRANETPQPKAVPEPVASVSVAPDAAAPDAAPRAAALPPSPFSIIARAPMPPALRHASDIASALPLVQRLPGGGLVIAAEYARARAEGPAPLAVELFAGGVENAILYRPAMTPGIESMRWVWSDASLSVVVDENETSRSGPRLASYKQGPAGFTSLRPDVGYWSAVAREGSVLALERTAYEVPNSSIYPKGSGYEQNEWNLRTPRIAVLAGKGPAPSLPAGMCARTMSAAPDGSLAVVVEKCSASPDPAVGVVRFAPAATQGKLDWLEPHDHVDLPPEVSGSAASATEIFVADGDRLHTWNGKAWTTTTPFKGELFGSISRAPSGDLWAVLGDPGRLVKRAAVAATWSEVTLPMAPADPLDEQPYALPTFEASDFRKVDALPSEQAIREPKTAPLAVRSVDASAEDVIVLAHADHEAFVLALKPRTPVARLPSIAVQRARLAQTMKRRVATSSTDCTIKSFLVFPEATTADAIRARLGDAGATAQIGEAIVEGQKRLVVHGEAKIELTLVKTLAALSPKRLCGPAVIERDL